MKRHARKLEHFSIGLMIFGVIALCQPWSLFLHSYSATIILLGIILFNIFSRLRPEPPKPAPGTDQAVLPDQLTF
jgi:hypothetical protein